MKDIKAGKARKAKEEVQIRGRSRKFILTTSKSGPDGIARQLTSPQQEEKIGENRSKG